MGDWGWETFPEWLDYADTLHTACDFAALIAHGAVRTYVMGERGADHQEETTPGDLQAIHDVVKQAVEAGAIGFASNRADGHQDMSGNPVPGTYAKDDEVVKIATAVGAAGGGVFECVSGFLMDNSLTIALKERELYEAISTAVSHNNVTSHPRHDSSLGRGGKEGVSGHEGEDGGKSEIQPAACYAVRFCCMLVCRAGRTCRSCSISIRSLRNGTTTRCHGSRTATLKACPCMDAPPSRRLRPWHQWSRMSTHSWQHQRHTSSYQHSIVRSVSVSSHALRSKRLCLKSVWPHVRKDGGAVGVAATRWLRRQESGLTLLPMSRSLRIWSRRLRNVKAVIPSNIFTIISLRGMVVVLSISAALDMV